MNNTKIPWAEKSWNWMSGCSAVSDGCANCYARRIAEEVLRGKYGYDAVDPFKITFHPHRLKEPLLVRDPAVIFCVSMGDMFHDEVPDSWRDQALDTMLEADHHQFLILTKRPARMVEYFNSKPSEIRMRLKHVWCGISAENQLCLNSRMNILKHLQKPMRLFLSLEPLLAPVILTSQVSSYIEWIIAGQENTKNQTPRPCDPEWIEELVQQAEVIGIPFFDKRDPWITRQTPWEGT